ncbi:MAG: UDP-3-O-acyl-N-acetylglucosamine deacetylase [Myxococcota bacterium]
MRQQTIGERVFCTGAGLHSGAAVQLGLCPARADSGIVFVRTDIDPRVEVPAHSASLASTNFATTLQRGDVSIGTVEHILSALYGLGIDNVRVEVDGPEIPVMDGSAARFVSLIRSAGLLRQRERRRTIQILRPIEIADNDRSIRIDPAPTFRISYAIDFPHPAIRHQELNLDFVDADRFENEIAGARTFGFLREVDALRSAGLALGGTLDNTIVLDDCSVINEDGLRWPDEFVRHKILDLFGDLALLGSWLQGHVHVEKGGHTLHQRLVSVILSNPDFWRLDHPDERVPSAFADNQLQYANSR